MKYSRLHMVRAAGELAAGLELDHFPKWGRPGIRAQLVDIKRKKLVMDFCCEADEKSFHVLNAVSPAYMCVAVLRVCVRRDRGEDVMHVVDMEIPEVKIITPKKFGDHRGGFSETYNRHDWVEAGIDLTFVQDNHSCSTAQGTLRGLHYQMPPMAQDKLVRVARGAILDVAVDLRSGSPTFGQHVTEVITAENWKQVLVPIGFAHGYVTLEPDTEVLYKTTDFYSVEHARGIIWNDPDLAIDWTIGKRQVILSEKDLALPLLSQVTDFFEYLG